MTSPRIVIVNRGSIGVDPNDPLAFPLPGAEVVMINLARALAAAGLDVSYLSPATAGCSAGVVFAPLEALDEVADGTDLRVIWMRDYNAPSQLFDRLPLATHVLMTGDSVQDMTHLYRRPRADIGAHLARYLSRFHSIVFASPWHVTNWREGFELPLENGHGIYNLATHVEWSSGPSPGSLAQIAHTSHPRKALGAVAGVMRRLAAAGQSFTCTCFGAPSLYQDDSCQVVQPSERGAVSLGSFSEFVEANRDVLQFRPPAAVNQIGSFLDSMGVLFHPDYSEETGATTVIEGIKRGLVPVVSDLGVLPQLVGEGGIVIPGASWTSEWQERCAAVLTDLTPAAARRLFDAQRARRHLFETSTIVAAWRAAIAI